LATLLAPGYIEMRPVRWRAGNGVPLYGRDLMNIPKSFAFIFLMIVSMRPASGAPILQWRFTANIYHISSLGEPIPLPFSAQVGDTIVGTFSLDYADPGEPYAAPYIRRYPNQPENFLQASVNGVPLADAPGSHRHDVEVWNDAEPFGGRDRLTMNYETFQDPRYPGLVVAMGLDNFDQDGSEISSLDLPTTFDDDAFDGLAFGLFIAEPGADRHYQLSALVVDIQRVPEPSTFGLLVFASVAAGRRRLSLAPQGRR
jgi:hypothetical protein